MSRNLKIAVYITSTGWGGLEMNTVKLSKLLMSAGFDVSLFTQENATINTFSGHEFQNVEYIQKRRKYFDFKTAKDLANRLKAANIKVVFLVDNKDLDVVSWAKRLFYPALKIVYQQHMQIGINKKDFLHTLRFKSIDSWISPLPFLKQEVGLRTHFPVSKVEVVPIGLDIEKFIAPKYTKANARKMLNIQTDFSLLGIIGRISRKKGQLFVAKAVLELKKNGQEVNLVIFGSATVNDEDDKIYAAELESFIKFNDLSDNVNLIDYKEDVAQFYNAIDVFILASHRETYGMVTIESMLSGIPVIATNSGGTPEILENGKLGYLYQYEDTDDFCRAYLELTENQQQTNQKVVAAKDTAIKTYDQQSEVNAISKILKLHLG